MWGLVIRSPQIPSSTRRTICTGADREDTDIPPISVVPYIQFATSRLAHSQTDVCRGAGSELVYHLYAIGSRKHRLELNFFSTLSVKQQVATTLPSSVDAMLAAFQRFQTLRLDIVPVDHASDSRSQAPQQW